MFFLISFIKLNEDYISTNGFYNTIALSSCRTTTNSTRRLSFPMSSETKTNILQEDSNTIEEKRRKNVIDNQHFLENLKLFNVRDDLKSTVNSVTTTNKPSRKKSNRKQIVD
ncbi:unnamed protein product, partial [Rotaria sp. Silwood2]